MPDPILTLGDLEPQRPTVAVWHTAPSNAWQAWKEAHLPSWALTIAPVRYERQRDLYAMRHPTEFSLEELARIQAAQREIVELQAHEDDMPSVRRAERLLRELSGVILDAPAEVLDQLSGAQHIQVLLAFPAAVTGMTPRIPKAPETPSISGGSFPSSATSTARTTG